MMIGLKVRELIRSARSQSNTEGDVISLSRPICVVNQLPKASAFSDRLKPAPARFPFPPKGALASGGLAGAWVGAGST